MKKVLTPLLGLILFASCSSDGDSGSTGPKEKTLLKKTISSYDGGPAITANYTYDKDTLKSISYSDGGIDNYLYEDGNLSIIEEYRNGNILKTTELLYEDAMFPAAIYRVDYNTNKVTATESVNHSSDDFYLYNYNVYSSGEFILTGASSLAFIEDNIMSNEIYNHDFLLTETHNYTYDSKNNPMRNVYANKVMVITKLDGGQNNQIKLNRTGLGSTWNITTNYTYTEEGFPATSTKTDKDGKIITTEYFYE